MVLSRTTTEFRQALLAVKSYQDRRRKKAALRPRQADEVQAVERVIESTRLMADGEARIKVIDLRFFKKSHDLPGAAFRANVSPETARNFSGDFVRAVAHELGYM